MGSKYRVFLPITQDELLHFLQSFSKNFPAVKEKSSGLALSSPLANINHQKSYIAELEALDDLTLLPPKNIARSCGILPHDELVLIEREPKMKILEVLPMTDHVIYRVANKLEGTWKGQIYLGIYPVVSGLKNRGDCMTAVFEGPDNLSADITDFLRSHYNDKFALAMYGADPIRKID